MTTEQCNMYIDHIYKVAPACILMKGAATAKVPNFLFRERSREKSNNNLDYFLIIGVVLKRTGPEITI
jgi:hypothetical protein